MKKLTALFLVLALLLSGCGAKRPTGTTITTQPSTEKAEVLLIHYIDVGQADCILIEYGDYHLLIDGGNKEDGSLVVSYLENQGIDSLDAVVCTHAHEDHVGGLPSVLAVYPTAAVYAPTRTYSSNIFDKFVYYTDQQGLEITIPAPGDVILSGELNIIVLGPVKSYAETNDTSIVLMVTFGQTKFLFTGDMETAAENDMLDYWGSKMDWRVDVLKVGHHGSETSTGYRFLNEVMPTYGVISVGEDNTYGHPHAEPLSRLDQADVVVMRTDRMGTILAVSDGSEITFTWEDASGNPTNVEPGEEETCFIGNKNSKKFHAETCSSLPKEENRVYFDSYAEALEAGYSPCGSCLN